jgi:FkbH-like protein
MADAGAAYSQASLVQTANQRLAEGCRKIGGAYIADWAGFVGQVGQENWFDAKIWYWTRNPFKREAMPRVAIFVARAIAAALRPACKCLVLDLDNTLWGGVLGEDGLDGIKLGGNYPGNVYQDFQRYILQLRHRGVLLALASKNNPEDVAQAFREHGEFILKLDDFAACQIHWEDKATSLRRIAAQLNIGLDSLAFFDDNPVERELVRLLAPEVKIIEAPVSPIDFAAAIEGCGLFDQYVISAEDRARHGMYQANQEREALRLQSADLNSFLADLRMSAQISPIDAVNAERVAQLIAKTNQFNLTLRRHSRSTVDKMLSSGAIGLSMRLSDRFGDHGLIAVAIAVPRGVSWEIDTFLMSCRVLGRQADTYLLAELIGQIRRRGGVEVCGLYVNGPKNQQVADFYLRHGFGAVEEQPGAFLWSAQKQSAIEHPGFIEAIAI